MKLCISCGMKQDEIIRLLEAYQKASQPTFRFLKKEGVKLYFESNMEDGNAAAALVKRIMKSDPVGNVLLYRIEVIE